MTKPVYLIQKTTSFFLSHVFAIVKSNFLLRLFFVVYIPIIIYHSYLFVNVITKPVNRDSRPIYEANLFNNNINNFNKFLTILKGSVDLDFEFKVTVDICMNSNFYIVDFYGLSHFIRLNFLKALTSWSTCISISPDPPFLCLLCFLFAYVFL